MKRDMDLVRKILFAVEEADGQADLTPLLAQGITERQLSGHSALIYKAGLAEGICNEEGLDGDCFCILNNLTWAGHDFIEAARNDTLWNKAKAQIAATGSALTIDALKAALGWAAMQALNGGG
jgi:hypothetical protein